MAPTPDIELSQVLGQNATSTAHLKLKESADVALRIEHGIPDRSISETTQFTTTATECSWNLYATAKLPKPTQVSNRAQFVDATSDEQIVRLGNAIFIPQPDSSSDPCKPFTLPKFSLFIDSIEKYGQYLFVTSRQHVTTIPEPKDEPAMDDDAKSKDEKSGTEDAKENTDGAGKAQETPTDAATKSKPDEDKANSSDDDDPADKVPEPESEDSSNELSADESWSEASTEYDSDQMIAEFRPVRPPQERVKMTSPSDSESSSGPEEEEASASDDSEDEKNLVEGKDKDERGRHMDTDEESDMYEAMFVTDRIDPDTDADDQSSAAGFDRDDLPDWADWSDGDGFQAMASDSEECSECGEDGGACALPPKDDIMPPSTKDEDLEEPVGSPVSQIRIYDLSKKATTTTNDESEPDQPQRIFHFKRETQQILSSSPPAIHPTVPLLVWPLGDNRILFADYSLNTYFIRKFQTSQFWSSHVSVNCRFSEDGQYLHVVAVEKEGKPPVLPKRVKKGKKASDAKKEKEAQRPKEEKPKYELIVSTYRVSESKTTRVPPVLIGRVQKNLGELDTLPTVSWSGVHVYISLSNKSICQIHRVDLGYPSTDKSKRSNQGKMKMQCFTIEIPEWAIGRELRFLPGDKKNGEGQLIVAAEAVKIPAYKPVTERKPEEAATEETNKSTTEEVSKATPVVDETSSSAPTTAKPEVNGTAASNDTDTDKPKESEPDTSEIPEPQNTSQPTQNGSTNTNNNANTVLVNTTEKTAEIDASVPAATATTKHASESEPKPAEPTPKPNPYPTTMTTTLSSQDIKSLGGWRDIVHDTGDNDVDTRTHVIENGKVNGDKNGEVSASTNGVNGESRLSFRAVHV